MSNLDEWGTSLNWCTFYALDGVPRIQFWSCNCSFLFWINYCLIMNRYHCRQFLNPWIHLILLPPKQTLIQPSPQRLLRKSVLITIRPRWIFIPYYRCTHRISKQCTLRGIEAVSLWDTHTNLWESHNFLLQGPRKDLLAALAHLDHLVKDGCILHLPPLQALLLLQVYFWWPPIFLLQFKEHQ